LVSKEKLKLIPSFKIGNAHGTFYGITIALYVCPIQITKRKAVYNKYGLPDAMEALEQGLISYSNSLEGANMAHMGHQFFRS